MFCELRGLCVVRRVLQQPVARRDAKPAWLTSRSDRQRATPVGNQRGPAKILGRRVAIALPISRVGRRARGPEQIMRLSLTEFLSDLFPEVGAPRYQRAAEMISFVLVATMLIGSLISSVFLLVYEL